MARKGKYTKKISTFAKAKRYVRRKWRWFKGLSVPKKLMLIGGPLFVFLLLTPLITYAYYFNDIADQERLMNRNNTGIVLTDKNGETIYSIGRAQHRNVVPIADISDNVKKALIAAEDKDFYEHSGFSITGIVRSFYNNISSQTVTGGGSTITQQLAKNTLLSEEQTFLRKYQELAISIAIEQRYSKDEILEMYLNSIFYGGTTFGIEDAAKDYFAKTPKDLTLAESSMLVGILPAPNIYSPTIGDASLAKKRQTTVLSRMVTNGYITEQQKQETLTIELAYAPIKEAAASEAPHFAEMVLSELYEKYGEEKVLRSGYQVRTTLDLNLQRKLVANVNSRISYIQRNGGSNASGVAIDPTSGEVRALAGSADWTNAEWGKVNMVTTPRQPGSSFKPIYFSEALAEGIVTPATIFEDKATDFNGYKPQNASRTYSGNISVRNALARSLNIPAVLVMQKLGIENSVEAAQRMGLSTIKSDNDYGLSLALGAAEVPLLNMANAYAAFANQGQQYPTTTIQQINNKYDDMIFKTSEKSKQVLTSEGAFLISSILSDNNARAPIFGSSLTVAGRTAAVKTGTTDDQRDAWTIGYTPQLVIGIWVGNNNNAAMINGGSGMAGPIWVNTMRQALEGIANTPFAQPSGVIQKPVCYSNGGLSSSSGNGTYNEFFLASALPTATCSPIPEKKVEEKPKETTTTDENDEEAASGSGDDDASTPTMPSNGGGASTPGTGTGTGTGSGSGTGSTTTPTTPTIPRP